MDPLRAALSSIAQQAGKRCRPTKMFYQVFVIHAPIKHDEGQRVNVFYFAPGIDMTANAVFNSVTRHPGEKEKRRC